MHENRLATGAVPRTLLGSLQHTTDPLAGGRGLLPFPQEPHPHSWASDFSPLRQSFLRLGRKNPDYSPNSGQQ